MSRRRYYRIINPSDRVTIASDNERVACVAVALISGGAYGLQRWDDGTMVLPILAFSEAPAHETWLTEHGIDDLGTFIEVNLDALASTLESVFYGDACEMLALEHDLDGLAPSDAAVLRRKHNDQRRSSMNNIELAALTFAAKLRAAGVCRQVR